MNAKHDFLKTNPEQERSEKAIEIIFEAATLLAISGDAKLLNIRELSERSGYSVGNIYHYFSKIDDLFSYVFNKRRERVHAAFGKTIKNFEPDATVNDIFTKLVDDSFEIWKQPHPALLNKMLRQYLKKSKEPEKFHAIADLLAPPLLETIRKNTSGTFRNIGENELRLLLRMVQQVIGAPFIEQDPIAGTAEHRKIAINSCCAVFNVRPSNL